MAALVARVGKHSCPAPNAMRGHADIKYTANAYEGTVLMTVKVEPGKPERQVKF